MPAIRKEMTTAGLQSSKEQEVVRSCGGSRHVGCSKLHAMLRAAERGV